jgi:hypothetical protein
MGKIADAMRRWLASYSGSLGKDALRYIETGDPAALGRIKPKAWEPWPHQLANVIAGPDAMSDEDHRALHALAAFEAYEGIGPWLSRALEKAKGDEDLLGLLLGELAVVKVPKAAVSAMIAAYVENLARDGRPNSAGRHLLALSDRDLAAAVKKAVKISQFYSRRIYRRLAGFLSETSPERAASLLVAVLESRPTNLYGREAIVQELAAIAPDRLQPLLDWLLDPKVITRDLCEIILIRGGDRYEQAVADAWRKVKKTDERLKIGELLANHAPRRYGSEVLQLARAILADPKQTDSHDWAGTWMVENHGDEVIDEIAAFIERRVRSEKNEDQYNCSLITDAAVRTLGKRAVPIVIAALRTRDVYLHFQALSELITLDDGAHGALILAELGRRLTDIKGLKTERYIWNETEALVRSIDLASRWKPAAVADRFWDLLGHKSKAVREAAARALGRIGAEVIPRAAGMLAERKADRRAAAVILLATAGTSEALRALEGRRDEEPDDDVRDAMLTALDAARAGAGREITREEIDRRIARTAPRLQAPVAAWLHESRLPELRYRDGEPLGPEATRYLLYRQSRVKEIRPDIEARPLYERIDRATSGDLALEVLRAFAKSKADAKDRWALAISGLLGDDRAVPVLNQMVTAWADSGRGQMAECAVRAMALLGTDAALMSLDAAATRYRNKMRNIGAAASEALAAVAERLGVTVDELGDRVVPRLGFEAGKPRIIEGGGKRIEVTVGPDFKLRYRDIEKGKAMASLPKSLPKETLAEFKDLVATLREVAKAQKLRLENLMVRQHRWPVSRWRELFLDNPVLFGPFATRLVWGRYDDSGALRGTFRALEDRTFTGPADEPFTLPDTGSVGIVHPLELSDEALAAWRAHLADYEVEPPFPQLERPIARVDGSKREVRMSRDLVGTSLNAMTFRGRAEKLGWTRGSGMDAGFVVAYRKVFPGAGVESYVRLDGLYMGIDMDESIELQEFCFVKAGTVQVGHYVDGEPANEDDARLIAFGAVPPVVYSEVMGDLRRIAGKTEEESDQDDD